MIPTNVGTGSGMRCPDPENIGIGSAKRLWPTRPGRLPTLEGAVERIMASSLSVDLGNNIAKLLILGQCIGQLGKPLHIQVILRFRHLVSHLMAARGPSKKIGITLPLSK